MHRLILRRVTAATLFAFALWSPANAHCIVGNRFFPATLIVEGIWPAAAFEEKRAINTLIGDDPVPPNGGAGFHDTAVWMRPA